MIHFAILFSLFFFLLLISTTWFFRMLFIELNPMLCRPSTKCKQAIFDRAYAGYKFPGSLLMSKGQHCWVLWKALPLLWSSSFVSTPLPSSRLLVQACYSDMNVLLPLHIDIKLVKPCHHILATLYLHISGWFSDKKLKNKRNLFCL